MKEGAGKTVLNYAGSDVAKPLALARWFGASLLIGLSVGSASISIYWCWYFSTIWANEIGGGCGTGVAGICATMGQLPYPIGLSGLIGLIGWQNRLVRTIALGSFFIALAGWITVAAFTGAWPSPPWPPAWFRF